MIGVGWELPFLVRRIGGNIRGLLIEDAILGLGVIMKLCRIRCCIGRLGLLLSFRDSCLIDIL